MVGTLLVRGMLIGILSGVLAFGFAWLFGEPQINLAIAFEEHARRLAGAAAEPELVSRAVQSTIGLLTGVVVYGCAFGGIFSLVFAYAYGRIGPIGPRATSAILALAAFVILILVPQIKYPANPPAVGDPATIGDRTALYFTMIALSLMTSIAALGTGRRMLARFGVWNAAIVGGVAYIVVVTIAMQILPPVDEVPSDFSAVTLWRFRLASIGIETVFWTTLGLVFGASADRLLTSRVDNRTTRRSH